MNQFIVSARKYRPGNFSSVVGQDSITTTLINTIKTKQLGHAYLFCGPHGVGKTTVARIFAKTINCNNLTSGYEPCNQCESCVSFNEMRAFNIHELDAASNNSVEDIRNLTDRVRIPPQVGKYNIYIIDEVHMLSAQAFNAFLKTLEEPPSHAIFILATTEKQKIIPTILSRCQIFDFNRIRIQEIVEYLEEIARKEDVEYEQDAFNIIALKADGAMRDALSIFDQMVSYSGKKITYKNVIENLNVLDYDYYFRITSAFLDGNISESLLIFNDILNEGFDGHNFIIGLGGHFRDLLVCRDPETMVLLETGATISQRYKEQSEQCDPEFLYKSLDICGVTDIYYKSSRNQKLHVELALIKLCQITRERDNKNQVISPEKEKTAHRQEDKSAGKQNKISDKSEDEKSSLPADQEQTVEELKGAGAQVKNDDQVNGKHTTNSDEPGNGEPEPDVLETEESEPGEMKAEKSGGLETEVHKPEEIKTEKHESDENNGGDSLHSPSKGEIYSPGYSIRDVLNGKNRQKTDSEEISQPTEGERDIRTESVSSENLNKAWNDFAEKIRADRPRMYNTLKGHIPEIGKENKIELVLDNTVQQDEFQKDIKQDMLMYMREVLKNDLIVIHTSVKTDEPAQTKLYTPEEKYKHMSKKNPDLDQLKKEFNLDFE